MSKNITWHHGEISLEERRKLISQKNKVLWLTGLSGCGKSTIARELEKKLYQKNILCYVLDGDNIRHGLNSDLGFSKKDRQENIRRVAHVAKLMYESAITVIVCFISPYQKEREYARELIGADFMEIFVDCPLELCEKRDAKGLYKKARSGEIKDFTGISAPYQAPKNPQLILKSGQKTPQECADEIISTFFANI